MFVSVFGQTLSLSTNTFWATVFQDWSFLLIHTVQQQSRSQVRELKSSQQTSLCTNNLSYLSVTIRVLMSIWTSQRKLHHSPSKHEMLSSSEGNLHFVCIKRCEYIWNNQKTTLGPITHNTQTCTQTYSLPFSGNSSYQMLGPSKWVDCYEWTLCWQFLLVGQQMQGWQMFLSFSAIALRTAARDTRMLEERASLYDCFIFSALGFPEFSPPVYSDWLLVLHRLHSFCAVLIWLTALQMNKLTSFLLLSLIRTEYLANSLSIQVCMHGTCNTADTMHAWTPSC